MPRTRKQRSGANSALAPIFDPASFRDPEGRVFAAGGWIIRTLSPSARERMATLDEAGLLESLAGDGLIVPTQRVAAGAAGLDPAAAVVTLLGFAWVFALRSLGLVGLGAMVPRRVWAPLSIVGGGISFFALIHLFVANSRYRLPIEPLLVLLAIYGLDAIQRGGLRVALVSRTGKG